MLSESLLLIKDACIFIDLFDLKIDRQFFNLGHRIMTTQFVANEILGGNQISMMNAYKNEGLVSIDSSGDFTSILELIQAHPGLSIPDASVLELAHRTNGILLSSDRSLRNVSINRGLTVKGLLWIIELLYKSQSISPDLAIKVLKQYSTSNPRAPKNEINTMIEMVTFLPRHTQ